jgi:hypothetical protein
MFAGTRAALGRLEVKEEGMCEILYGTESIGECFRIPNYKTSCNALPQCKYKGGVMGCDHRYSNSLKGLDFQTWASYSGYKRPPPLDPMVRSCAKGHAYCGTSDEVTCKMVKFEDCTWEDRKRRCIGKHAFENQGPHGGGGGGASPGRAEETSAGPSANRADPTGFSFDKDQRYGVDDEGRQHSELGALLELNLGATATFQDIKLAHRKLALEWHPDKNGDPNATEKFQRIQGAYTFLSGLAKYASPS